MVVVTGGSGFIGRHLIGYLSTRGHTVRVLVRDAEVPVVEKSRWVEIHPYGGLADTRTLKRACKGADVIVHLAARVHVMREASRDPLGAFRTVNVEGTGSVITAARHCGVKHLIFLSSVKAVAETSPPSRPLDRHTEPLPSDPYGISKLEAERFLEKLARDGRIAVTVLRPPLVYGPGVGGNMFRLLKLVDLGIPLPFGGIENRRSFLYVGNLTFAIGSLVDAVPRGYRSFFASDGVDLSTPDLLRLIGEGLGRPVRLVNVPDALLGLTARMGDVLNRVVSFPFSSAALQRLTDSLVVSSRTLWVECGAPPRYTPAEGLAATGRWFKDMIARDC